MGAVQPDLIRATPAGLYCEAGDFYVDPWEPVDRAVITHAHADHARGGCGAYLTAEEGLSLLRYRLRDSSAPVESLTWGGTRRLNGVTVSLHPAGHILGSAQVRIEHRGEVWVVTGDYKRAADPTCTPFELVRCHTLITEATFALPVFRHPKAGGEIARLLASLALFPGRSHLIGCYALGKSQRVIALLRQAGWERPIYLHGALMPLCRLYEAFGVPLGDLRPVIGATKAELAGAIVLAPPSAQADRWSARLADPVTALASGWMQVRTRARARGVELPLVISDHADWDALNATIDETGAEEVWVTHGAEEALVHAASRRGLRARALRLIGYGEEGGEADGAADGEAP